MCLSLAGHTPGAASAETVTIGAGCVALFAVATQAAAQAGTRQAHPVAVDAFPYLRSNRFLASFSEELAYDYQWLAWMQRMRHLDMQARRIELAGLQDWPVSRMKQLDDCSKNWLSSDLATPARLALLKINSRVKPEYSGPARFFGVYPLAIPFLRIGIDRYHKQVRQRFAIPLAALPVRGQIRTVAPASSAGEVPSDQRVARWLADAVKTDPLDIPDLDNDKTQALLNKHAPLWRIDTAGAYDRIGRPFRNDSNLALDTDRPVVYQQVAHTRFEGRVLIQLVYTAWFAARPAKHPFDILAGQLDALIWRVTLDHDGQPLLYDSIHSCGCYHHLFPTHRLVEKPQGSFWQEAVVIPQHAPQSGPIMLHVTSGSHYIARVTAAPNGVETGEVYHLEPYRSLLLQRPPLFDESGFIQGTQRAERWLLWPSGVRQAGSMRQWGLHAIAFVGQRHFDDARLFEDLLAYKPSAKH